MLTITSTSVMILCQMECRFASLLENLCASCDPGNSWRYSFLKGLVKPLRHKGSSSSALGLRSSVLCVLGAARERSCSSAFRDD